MATTRSFVDLNDLNGFSPILKSYIAGDEKLRPFYGESPTAEGINSLASRLDYPAFYREVIVKAFTRQYEEAGLYDGPAKAQIGLLKKATTYTVCTGHQLCLFTGPLYFIYKIISVINQAEHLKLKFPDKDFVPVYWMASEDHDFEEINHVQLFGKKLSWNKVDAEGDENASMPAGWISTGSLKTILDELKPVLGESGSAKELFQLVQEAYGTGRSLAEATRLFVHRLLGKYGVLILDPGDAALKALFAPVMEKELLGSVSFPLVKESIASLEKIGYQAQVNPREINLFYLREKSRTRIEKTEGKDEYKVLNTTLTFSKEELIKELNTNPERFSPNVVLRPLYQQFVLPNLAYTGGPGELAYWLEYKKMFEAFKVIFPVLIPRNFVCWIDANSAARMKKFNLGLKELSENLADIERAYVQQNLDESRKLDDEQEGLKKLFESVIHKASSADSTLKAQAEAELQKVLNGLKNLESKMAKAEKLRHETALNQIRNLKEKLFPGGALQERVENFMPLYVKQGAAFLDILKKELVPFENRLIVLTEEQVTAKTTD